MIFILFFVNFSHSLYAFPVPDVQQGNVNPLNSVLKGKKCASWTDGFEIRHVETTDLQHSFACLGYFHARDRGWQMDFLKKIAQGKKAETSGYKEIKSDYLMRLLGLERLSQQLFLKLSREDQDLLWAYTYGANQGLKEMLQNKRPLPEEFQSLHYLPELWHPSHSILLLLLQSFDQSHKSFKEQMDQDDRIRAYGNEAEKIFQGEGLPWSTSILKKGEYQDQAQKREARMDPFRARDQNVTQEFFSIPTMSEGSNNWVIGKSRSATGNTWLANDPHLELRRPPFWYWVHLKSNESDVIGSTVPGIPVFTAGTNRTLSWGLTTSYLPASRVAYVSREELGSIEESRPVIWFKLGFLKLPYFFKKIRRTNGLSGALPLLPVKELKKQEMVLTWSGYHLDAHDFHHLFRLHQSHHVQEFEENLSQIGIPSWNFVFTDQSGSIGYRANGKIPKVENKLEYGIPHRNLKELQSLPEFGHLFLSKTEMPHLINPKRDYIATANNRQWNQDSQMSIGEPFPKTFRAFRIEELIQKKEKHNLESIKQIQCDTQSVDARFLLPLLLPFLKQNLEVYHLLSQWDYSTSEDCFACAIYRGWVEEIYVRLGLNENALYRKLKQHSQIPDFLFENEILKSLKQTLHAYDMEGKKTLPRWTDIHQIFFPHLAKQDLFPISPIGTLGDKHSVNVAGGNWEDGRYHQIYGATQRMIVEMSQPPQIYLVLAGKNLSLARAHDFMDWKNCLMKKLEYPVENFSAHSDTDPIVLGE